MASRLSPKRLGAAILGASLVLMTAALPAAADAVVVKPHRDANEQGMGVHLVGKDREINTELIGLKIIENGKDQTATSYCVELPTPLEDNTPLEEVPWNEHPNDETQFKKNAKHVNWILHHSYPTLDVEAARTAFGLPDIKKSSLIAATQAAIWHYSDGAELRGPDATVEGDDVDADVLAVYKHLTGEKNVGLEQEPAPTLEIDPSELEGQAGTLIGPFTVVTTAEGGVVLKAEVPEGVTFTDKNGDPLPVAQEGQMGTLAATRVSEVFVKVAAGTEPNEVEFTVEATAKLHHGRLFVAQDEKKKTQSLVIAKTTDADVKDKAKVKWVEGVVVTTTPEVTTTTAPTTTTTATTEAPITSTTVPAGGGGEGDDLADTGASIFVPLLIGIGLLGAGAGALLFLRRKRTA